MFFNIALYLSLSICIVGIGYRVSRWFTRSIGPGISGISTGQRIISSIAAASRTVFSLKLILILKIIVFDVLLQVQILRTSVIRWLMHMAVFCGFTLLILMHALEKIITEPLFSYYASTLNPFLFLRNLFGAIVLFGIIIAIARRISGKNNKVMSNSSDGLALVLITLILISGFFLEASKIISSGIFEEMVWDYSFIEDDSELVPLQIYWEKEFGVVFAEQLHSTETDKQTIAFGKELHEESCMECHSKPDAAFVSYPISIAIRSVGHYLNTIRIDVWLYYVHILSCFIGLALLPFTKFFHLISTPVSLIANQEKKTAVSDLSVTATKRAISLDACVHCGACNTYCSVGPVFRINNNSNVLPSEKLISIKRIASGKIPDPARGSFYEGSFICTDCKKCTHICPAGINLQDLWQASKQDLTLQYTTLENQLKEAQASCHQERIDGDSQKSAWKFKTKNRFIDLTDNPETFSSCVQCSTCTNVCPVVTASDDPPTDLGLTPQQIMNLLRLNMKEMIYGSKMLWNCTTCYMCQEHCPHGIKIADILYQIRNETWPSGSGS